MNYYQFINSKDIREYLKKVNYEFSSIETAWLIFQCQHITLQEKFQCWERLTEEMPDCEIPKRPNCIYRESLHEFLKKYISILKQQYERFCQSEDNAVYQYEFYCKGDAGWCEEFDSIYRSEQECWKAIEEEMDLEIERILIRKRYFGTEPRYVIVEYNKKHEVMDIQSYILSDEESAYIYDSFDGMWFDFSVPFEKGDIVIEKTLPYPKERIPEKCAFVLTGVTPWNYDDVKRYVKKNGDNSDMNAWGYFQDEDGRIYNEVMHNYMNLEKYEGPITGKTRLLKALSEYVKGNIELTLLLSTYRKIIIEEFLYDPMIEGWFTEEQLELLGFKSIENVE